MKRPTGKFVETAYKDLYGVRFGSLVVCSVHQVVLPSGRRRAELLCRCDCGGERLVPVDRLVRGITTHCGCLHPRNLVPTPARTCPEYSTWVRMRQRCLNNRNKDYMYYGGRGIKICSRWATFRNFYLDMGQKPFSNASLDRINSDGDYAPDNCRWADSTTQNNNSSNCRYIEFKGETLTLTQWARKLSVDVSTLYERLKKWPLEKALTTPKTR